MLVLPKQHIIHYRKPGQIGCQYSDAPGSLWMSLIQKDYEDWIPMREGGWLGWIFNLKWPISK